MTSAKSACSVCFEALDAHTEATCNNCGQPYHLNQRSDIPGKDCGEVWIGEEHLALEFSCYTCLEKPVASDGTLDEILDAAEAALVTGTNEVALVEAADAGALRHRRTASGVYLFERGDLIAYAQRR